MGLRSEFEEVFNRSVDLIYTPLPEDIPFIIDKTVTVYERP